jgi:NADH:ubiquinone oxidoreductase subunit
MFFNFFKVVGRDRFGNSYYEREKCGKVARKVRYVAGSDAASVPAAWDLWLRYAGERPTQEATAETAEDFCGNLSGSALRNLPLGHPLRRKRVIYSSYKRWVP